MSVGLLDRDHTVLAPLLCRLLLLCDDVSMTCCVLCAMLVVQSTVPDPSSSIPSLDSGFSGLLWIPSCQVPPTDQPRLDKTGQDKTDLASILP